MAKNQWRLCFVSLFVGGALLPANSAIASQSSIVGEVTTVIGRATVIDISGEGQKVLRGGAVHAGDRLETEAGGHVHVRFIDGGLVSIRPLSRLHIEDYRRSKGATPGAIKFNLEHGVVRSVTGAWGEQDRERFRLNTPVVAIGIKGTDFVVRSETQKTLASVVSGAIVMAPLDRCATGLGACSGQDAVLLSADMSGIMLEFDKHQGGSIPKLVSTNDLEVRADRKGDPLAMREAASGDKALATGVENRLGDVVTTGSTSNVNGIAVKNAEPDKAMVWIRNPFGWNIAPNSISQRMSDAEVEGKKAVIGNFYLTLYRDEVTRSAYQGGVGKASFQLSAGSASYSRPGISYQPVGISNAKLDVNFQNQTYITKLDLNGAFGSTQFQSSGKITSSGGFQDSGSSQRLSGALSNDAMQAGYMFEKSASNGTVSGQTLWRR